MTDSRQERRLAILANPTESGKVECKRWLDLNDSRNKAIVAKAAIALANSGGGLIVFGVSEDNSVGGKLTCEPMPSEFSRYTSDAIGSAINKYADPDIDFSLVFENHPDSGEEYAFVEIAEGMQQPVFAKKQFDGVIKRLTCYVRKQGPKSEAPRTAQEWRDLLNWCVRANRDSMLDSIRTIIDGRPLDTTPTQSDEQKLCEFMARRKRVGRNDWRRLGGRRCPFASRVLGIRLFNCRRKRMANSTRLEARAGRSAISRCASSLFADVGGRGRSPYPAEKSIEAWTGHPEEGSFRTPFRCSLLASYFGRGILSLGRVLGGQPTQSH